MTAIGSSPEHRRVQDRWLRARVDVIVSSLPLTVVLNPVWALLSSVPLSGRLPTFGVVAMPFLAGVIVLHLMNSAITYALLVWARSPGRSPHQVLVALIALHFWISASWGGGVLLWWVEGNALNNTYLALLVLGLVWALALTRSAHPVLLAAGIFPLAAMYWLRSMFAGGEVGQMFTIMTPVFVAYAWFMGASARDRVDELLRSRFAIEDMARALDAARLDAEEKGAEAEAASVSKSAFVANMSHELRTPLNAILGFAEIIENQSVGQEVPEQYRDYARDIHSSGTHLLNLINDMLDIAKIESGRMEIDRHFIDVKANVEAAVRMTGQHCDAKRQMISLAVDENVRLFADERAFKQMLLNLLSNASKFSPDGGAILVRCAGQASGAVLLSVENSGPGIPVEKLKLLFKPFSQVDNRYDRSAGGTGLGLSLVRGLVALHGGRVWLENNPAGTGLVASVEFPSADCAARAA